MIFRLTCLIVTSGSDFSSAHDEFLHFLNFLINDRKTMHRRRCSLEKLPNKLISEDPSIVNLLGVSFFLCFLKKNFCWSLFSCFPCSRCQLNAQGFCSNLLPIMPNRHQKQHVLGIYCESKLFFGIGQHPLWTEKRNLKPVTSCQTVGNTTIRGHYSTNLTTVTSVSCVLLF